MTVTHVNFGNKQSEDFETEIAEAINKATTNGVSEVVVIGLLNIYAQELALQLIEDDNCPQ